MAYDYKEILTQEGISESELPDKVRDYIKRKMQTVKTSTTFMAKEQTKEKPNLNKIKGFQNSIDNAYEDIEMRVIAACNDIQEAKEKQPVVEKTEPEVKPVIEKPIVEKVEKTERPVVEERRKLRFFKFTKRIEDKPAPVVEVEKTEPPVVVEKVETEKAEGE